MGPSQMKTNNTSNQKATVDDEMTPLCGSKESSRMISTSSSPHDLKIVVVGGGVAGITTLRVLKSRGFTNLTLYEASDVVSGVWSQGYPNFAIQTPGNLYEFPDKPLPEPKDYKDGPSIRKYCEDYVKEHGLTRSIHLSSEVTAIESAPNDAWSVTVCRRTDRSNMTNIFDLVVLATGLYSPNLKYIPPIKGLENFQGTVCHSQDTARLSLQDRRGKKVVVVGFGKSAHDTAMNAAQETGDVAPTLLFRNAHWCVPRKVLGLIPMEWLLYSRFGQGTLPRWMECGPVEYVVHTAFWPLIWVYWRIVETILTFQLGLYGSTGAQLRPTLNIENDMYCGHGLICHPDMFPMFHQKKVLALKGSIREILPTGQILLEDGTTMQADQLVFATGFKQTYEFLPKNLLRLQDNGAFYAYRNMIVPGVPNILFLNSNVTTFSNITTPGIQAAWLSEVLQGGIELPSTDVAVQQVAKDKEWRQEHLTHAEGSAKGYMIQLHQTRYWDSLLRDMGAVVKRKRVMGISNSIWNALPQFFVPVYSSDYKDIITGDWKKDPSQVCQAGYTPSFWLEWTIFAGAVGGAVAVMTL